MKNPEWSPGTWTYDPEEAAVVSDHEPHIIAPLFGQCEDADGYLMAASKDLYEALAGLLTGHPSGDSPEQKIGRAALAKARGESQ